MGLMHMEVDKVAAVVVNMEDDMVSDKAAARISRKCYFTILAKFHNPGRFSQLRHLIRVVRKHDLTNKKTRRKTKTMTMTNTFR